MDGMGWMIILVLPFLWMGYGLALLIITGCAFESKGIRRVLLWGVAPQFIILCIATLLLYWINSRLIYVFVFFQPVLCITTAIFLFAGKKTQYSRLLFTLSHVIFLAGILYQGHRENLQYIINNDWKEYKITRLFEQVQDNGAHALNNDVTCSELMQLLTLAAERDDVKEETLRTLIAKKVSPFLTMSDNCTGENSVEIYSVYTTPFMAAIQNYNIHSVRFFSQLLMGNSPKAKNNRDIVRRANPLIEVYKYSHGSKKQRKSGLEISKQLMAIMPELLTDAVWRTVLNVYDADAARWFWRNQPPENRLYRLKAMALIPQTDALLAEIRQTPEVLNISSEGDFNEEEFLHFLIFGGDTAVIRALVEKGIVNWRHLMNIEGGDKDPLIWSISRLRENDNDREVLALIIHDINAQNALPEERIAKYLTRTGSMGEIFLKAGVHCDKLYAAIESDKKRNNGMYSQNAREEVDRVCTPAK
ncbi:TPA: hypothetical protein L6787_000570 [Escherichia coli]|uniref:hypothetical protein n=1 Tax=Escherichia coli TaxID=562 RepID=UPI0010CB38E3|nr:hypothetical protein [Escherichia coli]EFB5449627.1 hypothetical protein [Escherichia coli O157]EFO0906198.1 hypothetical protein [Escherichia coli O157]EFO1903156.1 hypothetical protein [Escherichia coli]EFO1909507.1 hypothetical protein [Escherichia coli O157]EGN7867076.1 hypothetical protein [Escherichia coli]